MGEITTMGLDLAKQVFQVHGIDADGTTVLRKQLRRSQVLSFFSRLAPCLVGMEACATAHYWGQHQMRLFSALDLAAAFFPASLTRIARTAITVAITFLTGTVSVKD